LSAAVDICVKVKVKRVIGEGGSHA
jgi:hypothetical protein